MDPEFIGEMREFKRAVLEDLKEIKADVKSNSQWRWKVAGIAAATSTLISVLFGAFKLWEMSK